MDNLLGLIYKSPKTVLTIRDIAILWQETNTDNLKSKIAYYVRTKALIRLSRGIYAKDKNYKSRELATSIYVPSYLSFETVLRDVGIIFQHYNTLFLAGPWSKTVIIRQQRFEFRKLKSLILYNPSGIVTVDNYSIAVPERAFLDTIYLSPRYYFDNLRPLDWDRCLELVEIYGNQQLKHRLQRYKKIYA